MKLTFIYLNVPYYILMKPSIVSFMALVIGGIFLKKDSLLDVKNKLIN